MTDQVYVLDASALLALLGREPGGDIVATVISASSMSTVNWSEVIQKARSHGVDTGGLQDDVASLGLGLLPFGVREAEAVADLWHSGARHLSLADRACLATAQVNELAALTADGTWAELDLDVEVRVIR